MDANQKAFAELTSVFIKRMEAFEGELKKSTPANNISSLAADFLSFKNFILTALTALQNQMILVSKSVDNLEMRSRRKLLLLHGVPETKQEDVTSVVKEIICEKLKFSDFKVDDISRCHRMGKVTSSKPRPVLIKLADPVVRTKIWATKTHLKGSGITVSEFLTKYRHELFMKARNMFGISKCWTRNGMVFVLSPDGSRHCITQDSDLINISAPETQRVPASAPRENSKSRRNATKK